MPPPSPRVHSLATSRSFRNCVIICTRATTHTSAAHIYTRLPKKRSAPYSPLSLILARLQLPKRPVTLHGAVACAWRGRTLCARANIYAHSRTHAAREVGVVGTGGGKKTREEEKSFGNDWRCVRRDDPERERESKGR